MLFPYSQYLVREGSHKCRLTGTNILRICLLSVILWAMCQLSVLKKTTTTKLLTKGTKYSFKALYEVPPDQAM